MKDETKKGDAGFSVGAENFAFCIKFDRIAQCVAGSAAEQTPEVSIRLYAHFYASFRG